MNTDKDDIRELPRPRCFYGDEGDLTPPRALFAAH